MSVTTICAVCWGVLCLTLGIGLVTCGGVFTGVAYGARLEFVSPFDMMGPPMLGSGAVLIIIGTIALCVHRRYTRSQTTFVTNTNPVVVTSSPMLSGPTAGYAPVPQAGYAPSSQQQHMSSSRPHHSSSSQPFYPSSSRLGTSSTSAGHTRPSASPAHHDPASHAARPTAPPLHKGEENIELDDRPYLLDEQSEPPPPSYESVVKSP